MKKSILLSFFTFLLSHGSFAQFTITGQVSDMSQKSLSFASVVVLQKSDSTMVAFGMSNDDGLFKVNLKEKGDYIIQCSFLGFTTSFTSIQSNWETKKITVPNIVLEVSSVNIQEVKVESERIPMGIKNDTIVYDAKAFKTREGATVEDLLRKLPGIEVQRDGSIKAQGEDVKKVLVDGKEFFGSDPKIATKNLEAEAIDKVELFDKKSEIAEFTGVDDGEEEKTINLTLKEDYKKGGFGRAKAAIGTEETFYAKLNYNLFNTKSQLSFIGNGNNINEQAFTFQDYIDFLGGLGNIGSLNSGMIMGGSQEIQGINSAYSLGSNLNHSFNEKLSINANYFYLDNTNKLNKQINASNFGAQNQFESNEILIRDQRDKTHRINSKLKWKKNPYTAVTINNNFKGVFNRLNNRSTTIYTSQNALSSSTLSNLLNQEDQFSWDSKILLKKKFKKKGRNWISRINYLWMDALQTNRISNNAFGLGLNQFQDFNTHIEQQGISSTYTEPINKKWFTSLRYGFNRDLSNPNRTFFDLKGENQVLNSNLSGNFNRLVWEHRTKISLRRNTKKIKAVSNLEYANINLRTIGADRVFNYLLPSAKLDFKLKSSQSLDLSYNTNINVPSLSQLITIPNNVDPNRQYVGNNNLIPEKSHSISVSYNYFDSFNFTSLFLNLMVQKTNHKIVNQTNVNPDFTITSIPINTDLYESFRGFLSFSQPLRPLGISYKIGGNFTWSNYNAWLNNKATEVGEQNYATNFSIERKNKEKWDFEAGLRMSWTSRKYAINTDFDQNFANYDWYLDLFWDPKADLLFKVGYTMRQYNDVFFSEERQLHFINASASKSFKDNKWTVELSANDILNQTIGLSRLGNDNSLREENYNTLAQYFMLSLSYKIKKKREKTES